VYLLCTSYTIKYTDNKTIQFIKTIQFATKAWVLLFNARVSKSSKNINKRFRTFWMLLRSFHSALSGRSFETSLFKYLRRQRQRVSTLPAVWVGLVVGCDCKNYLLSLYLSPRGDAYLFTLNYRRSLLWRCRFMRILVYSVRHSVVPINSSLLNLTLYFLVITTFKTL
jgi:hypothetical protein